MWEHHMQWHGWEHHMFGWWGIIFLVVLVLLVAAVVAVLRSDSSRPLQTAAGPADDEAMEVLRRRYAEGEIDREEFERKRRNLER